MHIQSTQTSLSPLLMLFFQRLLALTLLLLTCSAMVFSQAKEGEKKSKEQEKKKKKPEFSVEFGVRSMYDDNILKYSDKYLERFMNRQDEGRFHIDTYDDIIIRPSLKTTASYRFIKNLRTDVDILFNRSQYVVNNIKTWDFFSTSLRQFYGKKGHVRVSYSYIPEFYIRHYRDEDYTGFVGFGPESFKPMSFSKETIGFWVQHGVLKKTNLRLSVDYMNYYYNVHYIEYDSKDISAEIKLFQNFSEKLRFQAAYSFTNSKAKGFDQAHETFDTSDDADASFVDNSFSASVTYKLPSYFGLSHDISFDGKFGERHFSSRHYIEYDMLHAGRRDYNYNLSVSYGVRISKTMNASIFYNYLERVTDSKSSINYEMVMLEKSYRQNQIGFALTYSLSFKK
jgi:hypothetical protein